MGMTIYSGGTSETGHEDHRLEYTQIESLVGVDDDDDAVFDRQSGERSVKCSLSERAVGGVMDSRRLWTGV